MNFERGEIIRDQHGLGYVFARGFMTSWMIYDPRRMLLIVVHETEEGGYIWNDPNHARRDGVLVFETTGEIL